MSRYGVPPREGKIQSGKYILQKREVLREKSKSAELRGGKNSRSSFEKTTS